MPTTFDLYEEYFYEGDIAYVEYAYTFYKKILYICAIGLL